MSKKAYDLIAEGLTEAIAIVKGEAKPARVHIPSQIDVKRIIAKLELTQAAFASQFGFCLDQIEDWEQGRSCPLGGARVYLTLIDKSPAEVLDLLTRTSALESSHESSARP